MQCSPSEQLYFGSAYFLVHGRWVNASDCCKIYCIDCVVGQYQILTSK